MFFILIIIFYVLMFVVLGGLFNIECLLLFVVFVNFEVKYGFDQLYWKQVVNYVYNIVFYFDFGVLFKFKDCMVMDFIVQGFFVILIYGVWFFVIVMLVGVLLGVVVVVCQNMWLDYFVVGVFIGVQVLFNFVMGLLLVIVFILWLGWLLNVGWNGGQWQYVIMFVIVLLILYMVLIVWIMWFLMFEVLNIGFICMVKVKGLFMCCIIMCYVFKFVMLLVFFYFGLVFVGMIIGFVVIDVYFLIGGMGIIFVNVVFNCDYLLMMGVIILVGVLIIIFNFFVDLFYVWIDLKICY